MNEWLFLSPQYLKSLISSKLNFLELSDRNHPSFFFPLFSPLFAISSSKQIFSCCLPHYCLKFFQNFYTSSIILYFLMLNIIKFTSISLSVPSSLQKAKTCHWIWYSISIFKVFVYLSIYFLLFLILSLFLILIILPCIISVNSVIMCDVISL